MPQFPLTELLVAILVVGIAQGIVGVIAWFYWQDSSGIMPSANPAEAARGVLPVSEVQEDLDSGLESPGAP